MKAKRQKHCKTKPVKFEDKSIMVSWYIKSDASSDLFKITLTRIVPNVSNYWRTISYLEEGEIFPHDEATCHRSSTTHQCLADGDVIVLKDCSKHRKFASGNKKDKSIF